MCEELSDDEIMSAYREPWDPEGTSAADIRSKVKMELAGNLDYILNQHSSEQEFHNGIRDKGRDAVTLSYFVNHERAAIAGLSEAHVIALRLYTTHAFKYINTPLRRSSDSSEPHPLPVTVSFISEGIKKLRAVQAAAGGVPPTLWRGMRNMQASGAFLEHHQGGTE